MTLIAFILTCLLAIVFVLAVGIIVNKSRFREPYATYTLWGAGALALLYVALALLGEAPMVPVPPLD